MEDTYHSLCGPLGFKPQQEAFIRIGLWLQRGKWHLMERNDRGATEITIKTCKNLSLEKQIYLL